MLTHVWNCIWTMGQCGGLLEECYNALRRNSCKQRAWENDIMFTALKAFWPINYMSNISFTKLVMISYTDLPTILRLTAIYSL